MNWHRISADPNICHDEEDKAGAAWASGISGEWWAELSDCRDDMYTLADGEPVDDRIARHRRTCEVP